VIFAKNNSKQKMQYEMVGEKNTVWVKDEGKKGVFVYFPYDLPCLKSIEFTDFAKKWWDRAKTEMTNQMFKALSVTNDQRSDKKELIGGRIVKFYLMNADQKFFLGLDRVQVESAMDWVDFCDVNEFNIGKTAGGSRRSTITDAVYGKLEAVVAMYIRDLIFDQKYSGLDVMNDDNVGFFRHLGVSLTRALLEAWRIDPLKVLKEICSSKDLPIKFGTKEPEAKQLVATSLPRQEYTMFGNSDLSATLDKERIVWKSDYNSHAGFDKVVQKPLRIVDDEVLKIIRDKPDVTAKHVCGLLLRAGIKSDKKEVNRVLYRLNQKGHLAHDDLEPPRWRMARESDMDVTESELDRVLTRVRSQRGTTRYNGLMRVITTFLMVVTTTGLFLPANDTKASGEILVVPRSRAHYDECVLKVSNLLDTDDTYFPLQSDCTYVESDEYLDLTCLRNVTERVGVDYKRTCRCVVDMVDVSMQQRHTFKEWQLGGYHLVVCHATYYCVTEAVSLKEFFRLEREHKRAEELRFNVFLAMLACAMLIVVLSTRSRGRLEPSVVTGSSCVFAHSEGAAARKSGDYSAIGSLSRDHKALRFFVNTQVLDICLYNRFSTVKSVLSKISGFGKPTHRCMRQEDENAACFIAGFIGYPLSLLEIPSLEGKRAKNELKFEAKGSNKHSGRPRNTKLIEYYTKEATAKEAFEEAVLEHQSLSNPYVMALHAAWVEAVYDRELHVEESNRLYDDSLIEKEVDDMYDVDTFGSRLVNRFESKIVHHVRHEAKSRYVVKVNGYHVDTSDGKMVDNITGTPEEKVKQNSVTTNEIMKARVNCESQTSVTASSWGCETCGNCQYEGKLTRNFQTQTVNNDNKQCQTDPVIEKKSVSTADVCEATVRPEMVDVEVGTEMWWQENIIFDRTEFESRVCDVLRKMFSPELFDEQHRSPLIRTRVKSVGEWAHVSKRRKATLVCEREPQRFSMMPCYNLNAVWKEQFESKIKSILLEVCGEQKSPLDIVRKPVDVGSKSVSVGVETNEEEGAAKVETQKVGKNKERPKHESAVSKRDGNVDTKVSKFEMHRSLFKIEYTFGDETPTTWTATAAVDTVNSDVLGFYHPRHRTSVEVQFPVDKIKSVKKITIAYVENGTPKLFDVSTYSYGFVKDGGKETDLLYGKVKFTNASDVFRPVTKLYVDKVNIKVNDIVVAVTLAEDGDTIVDGLQMGKVVRVEDNHVVHNASINNNGQRSGAGLSGTPMYISYGGTYKFFGIHDKGGSVGNYAALQRPHVCTPALVELNLN
jgi:hypothetical protein